jgi:hypothetical protein
MQMNNGKYGTEKQAVLPKSMMKCGNCKLLFQLKPSYIYPFQWIWARLVLSDVKGYKQVTHTGGLEGCNANHLYS